MEDIDILKLKSGSKEEFKKFYLLYFNRLYRFAYHYVMSEDAEDIVHDVFLKIYENVDKIPEDMSFNSYMFTSVKNSCLNYLRHKNVVDKNQDKLLEVMLYTGEELNDDTDVVNRVKQCLMDLPDKQRIILEMKFRGYDYNFIAKTLNITIGTVNTHINRAYKFIRNKILFLLF